MRPILTIPALAVAALLGGCPEGVPNTPAKQSEAEKAARVANSIRFTENAEIDNIKNRLTQTASPDKLGFIILLNESGQPVLYEGVRGKVTSGGKRLTPPVQEWSTIGETNPLGPSPSDEGTWGSSGEYIFYWTLNGEYRQWNGKYLYSDKPLRLNVQPIAVSVAPAAEQAAR